MITHLKKQGSMVSRHVQFGPRYHSVVGATLCDLVCEIHSREDEQPSEPVELTRPGPSHCVVISSPGV